MVAWKLEKTWGGLEVCCLNVYIGVYVYIYEFMYRERERERSGVVEYTCVVSCDDADDDDMLVNGGVPPPPRGRRE